jgi:hypothetical protein
MQWLPSAALQNAKKNFQQKTQLIDNGWLNYS